ncbi:hypothetical protein [Candidimonas nitroreducens]|uniref:Uncharacterized protein n=1 Tax=Candidimonas nitroreducens TaxID=683354 RepID=A0A225MNG1_9BURK|nr:hypothetical protein [Candidimonas nitroreducens]OWT61903.1 hypothetical protein CEY11_08740 [Candidimonas nitroreducens]
MLAPASCAPAYRTFYLAHTVLSRLEGREFKPVAYLPGRGCLVPVPGTGRLLLLTSARAAAPVLIRGATLS